MKSPNKIPLVIFLVVSGFTSCKKYLDKKSDTGRVIPTSVSDLQALLDESVNMNLTRTPALGEASADDYFLLESDYNNRPQMDQNAYKWVPEDNYAWPNDWSYAYTPVYTADYCLEQIENNQVNSINESSWNNVKGSALFFRAYYFSQLVWTYAKAYDETTSDTDLGIPLRLSSDFNLPSVRASVKESYERIISDAKEAANYLPNTSLHTFRPSKSAVYGLLGRTYLTMGQYDSALKYSNLCLQIKNDLINYNGDADIVNPFSGTSSPFKQFNKETIFYTEMTFNVGTVSLGIAKTDSVLYTTYASNDLRKQAFFRPAVGYQRFKANYTQATTVQFTGLATDEMYLTRAESYARKADKTSALNDLNTLLSKRYDATFVPVTANSANEALQKILLERRKELLMRGLRFIDIKRLNKEGANIVPKRFISGQTITLPPNDNRYALPIPREVIIQSGMPQNPY